LEVVVVHTTVEGTLQALRVAAQLARGLHARIRLLVPQVVPYPLPLDGPAIALDFTNRRFRTMASGASIDTSVDIRLGRDRGEILESALDVRSLVVVCRGRGWWPTSERRLARKLESLGHQVVRASLN
jgi:hypothetical protein